MKELQKSKCTKVRCIRIKDNTTFIAKSLAEASKLTGVPRQTISRNMNWDDKIAKGWKFYDYGFISK